MKQRNTRKSSGRKKFFQVPQQDVTDLGFGSKVTQESTLRLLNRDGSFNVARDGLPFFQSVNAYHALITMSWPKFMATILTLYFLINAIFACAYLLCGPHAFQGTAATTLPDRFMEAFFFSVQTFTTVGYGYINPQGYAANFVATFDAFVGLLSFAFATGLLFARFARPTAKIVFSDQAIVAPYRGIQAFEFRMANARHNQLVDVAISVYLNRVESVDGKQRRRFHELPLERKQVAFFPLHLTVVHPIDEESPLNGVTRDELDASEAEFLILITAFDETFSQTVHSRSSYKADEIVWGASFSSMFHSRNRGVISVDLRRLHEFEVRETQQRAQTNK